MQEAPCPGNWEYSDIAGCDTLLPSRSANLLITLRSLNVVQKDSFAQDTRPAHSMLFKLLTPQYFPFYAGNYRGEGGRCLDQYEVGVPGDPSVGHAAVTVPLEMNRFASKLRRMFNELNVCWSAPNSVFPPEEKLFRAIELAASAFVYFLEIHPYANGNGHMGRYLLLAIIGRHDVYPRADWDVHPRPNEPAYSQAIVAYRNGDKSKLHMLLLACF